MAKVDARELEIAELFERFGASSDGQAILKHLLAQFGVEQTIGPEEQYNAYIMENHPERPPAPIDTYLAGKREGRRAAYWEIVHMTRLAAQLRKQD